MPTGELTFLHAGEMPTCSARIDKHWAGYASLQLITRGTVRLSYDQDEQILAAPAVWACYPGPRIAFHSARPGRDWHHRYVAFRGPRLEAWRQEGLWPLAPTTVGQWVDTLVQRFDQLLGCVLAVAPGRLQHLRGVNLLEGLLIDLSAAGRDAETDSGDAIDRIAETLARPGHLSGDYETLARQHGMALSTLRRRFRQKMGMPLHSYVLAARIAEAKRLLLTTDWPIKVIADRLAFRDVYYFSRQFRQRVGLPPAKFRRDGAI